MYDCMISYFIIHPEFSQVFMSHLDRMFQALGQVSRMVVCGHMIPWLSDLVRPWFHLNFTLLHVNTEHLHIGHKYWHVFQKPPRVHHYFQFHPVANLAQFCLAYALCVTIDFHVMHLLIYSRMGLIFHYCLIMKQRTNQPTKILTPAAPDWLQHRQQKAS